MDTLDSLIVKSDMSEDVVSDLIDALEKGGMPRKQAAKLANDAAQADPYPDMRMATTIAKWVVTKKAETVEEHVDDIRRFKSSRKLLKDMRIPHNNNKLRSHVRKMLDFDPVGRTPEDIAQWARSAEKLTSDDNFDDTGLHKVAEHQDGNSKYIMYRLSCKEDGNAPLMKTVTYCIVRGSGGYGGYPYYIVMRQRKGGLPEQFAAILPGYGGQPSQAIRDSRNSSRLAPENQDRIAPLIKAAFEDYNDPASRKPSKPKQKAVAKKRIEIVVPPEAECDVFDPTLTQGIAKQKEPLTEEQKEWLRKNSREIDSKLLLTVIKNHPDAAECVTEVIDEDPAFAGNVAQIIPGSEHLQRAVMCSLSATQKYAKKHGYWDLAVIRWAEKILDDVLNSDYVPERDDAISVMASTDGGNKAYRIRDSWFVYLMKIPPETAEKLILRSKTSSSLGYAIERDLQEKTGAQCSKLIKHIGSESVKRKLERMASARGKKRQTPRTMLTQAIDNLVGKSGRLQNSRDIGNITPSERAMIIANQELVVERIREKTQGRSGTRVMYAIMEHELFSDEWARELLNMLVQVIDDKNYVNGHVPVSFLTRMLDMDDAVRAQVAKLVAYIFDHTNRRMGTFGKIYRTDAQIIRENLPPAIAEQILLTGKYLPTVIENQATWKDPVSVNRQEMVDFADEIIKYLKSKPENRVLSIWGVPTRRIMDQLSKKDLEWVARHGSFSRNRDMDADEEADLQYLISQVADNQESLVHLAPRYLGVLISMADDGVINRAALESALLHDRQETVHAIQKYNAEEFPGWMRDFILSNFNDLPEKIYKAMDPEGWKERLVGMLREDPLNWSLAKKVSEVTSVDVAKQVLEDSRDKFGGAAVDQTIKRCGWQSS